MSKTNKIGNEKGEVTIDTAEIQRIIKDYYKQLFANKINSLEEMGSSQRHATFQK